MKKKTRHSPLFTHASPGFHQHIRNLVWERIKFVSIMLIVSCPCSLLLAIFIFNKWTVNSAYVWMFTSIYLFSFLLSVLFMILYKNHIPLHLRYPVIYMYILLYLLIGAVSSISSQLLTGNIYAYLIILIGTAIIFPIKPTHLLMLLSGVHLIFLIGLYVITDYTISILMKQINATGATVIAFTIAYSFYSFRKKDYINQTLLKENEVNFKRLFEMNPNPLILIKLKENIVLLLNQKAMDHYGLKEREKQGLTANFLFHNADEMRAVFERAQREKQIANYIATYDNASGSTAWAMMNVEMVDYFNEQCLLVGVIDVTSFKETEEELFKHASIDALTGVMNRRRGMEVLQQLTTRSASAQNFILCYIDINNLKTVNDTYGHKEGDVLIRKICEILTRNMDESDILFRLGGDEFIILFLEKQLPEAQFCWSKIIQDFEQLNKSAVMQYPLSASHGLYQYQAGTEITPDEILAIADENMYKEKTAGRNQKG